MMRILLTNDDGISAPGLAALYHAVSDLGEVAVAAPARAQTGVGHGITVRTPMVVERVRVGNGGEGWSVDGRPADCVKLAMLELLEWRPDFVLSGINTGLNTGLCTLYSGTVAGAAEAAVFFDIPSMAVSLQTSDDMNYERAGAVAARVFETYAKSRPQPRSCISVNLPTLDQGWPKGVRVCPQSTTITKIQYRRETDRQGRTTYYFDGGDPELIGDAGTDADAVRQGYLSITPLSFAYLDPSLLAELSHWDWPELAE